MSGTTSFQAFSPAYENLSNRMSRLRHNSQQHHKSYTMSVSPPKAINLFTLDSNKHNRRVSPSTFNLANETISSGTGKFTGRVTKNVGLKKYNQRQIKQVMNNRENTHVKAESSMGAIRIHTESDTPRESTGLDKWHVARVDEVKMNEEESSKENSKLNRYNEWQNKLIPGKLYKREYLCQIMRTDHL